MKKKGTFQVSIPDTFSDNKNGTEHLSQNYSLVFEIS